MTSWQLKHKRKTAQTPRMEKKTGAQKGRDANINEYYLVVINIPSNGLKCLWFCSTYLNYKVCTITCIKVLLVIAMRTQRWLKKIFFHARIFFL